MFVLYVTGHKRYEIILSTVFFRSQKVKIDINVKYLEKYILRYLDEVEILDEVDTDDDVDTELEVETLKFNQ